MRSRRHTARWWRGLALLATATPTALVAQVTLNCTPPPPVPDSVAMPHTGRPTSWTAVSNFIAANGIVFGADDTKTVTPCGVQGCGPATITLLTDTMHTNCLSRAMADSTFATYFLGAAVQASRTVNLPLGFGGPNQTDTVYLLVRHGSAYAMYRNAASQSAYVRFRPDTSGWSFHFNADGDTGKPAAQWRWRPTRAMSVQKETGPAGPANGDEVQTGYTYAWMQCIAGCCQLIGTGDGPPLDDDDYEEHHGGHHHHGHGDALRVDRDALAPAMATRD